MIYDVDGREILVDDDDAHFLYGENWKINKSTGYVYANHRIEYGKFKTVNLHRLIINPGRGFVVDHINGNPLDNRRSNLRVATTAQNIRNSKISKVNTTGYKGVQRYNKKYKASICFNRKKIHLGYFNDPYEAYMVYCEAAKSMFGEFARIDI